MIVCKTLEAEVCELAGAKGIPFTSLEFGLHNTPDRLHRTLQEEIDRTPEDVDTILFGYGICSRGAIGLEARRFRLVIPRVDDCIALFLGSREEYLRQFESVPGTFYLTRGWIEHAGDPYSEYLKLEKKYGAAKALELEKMAIEHYTRMALINTGSDGAADREYARFVAEFFGWAFEEIAGSRRLLQKLVSGEWDDDFLVVEPGGRVGDIGEVLGAMSGA
jgi:hypothetical protein